MINIILAALAGGIWTRNRDPAYREAARSPEIGPALESSELKPTGSFEDPLTGMKGFEVSLPGCASPLAVLLVPTSTPIIPGELRYRNGDYRVSYFYNGQAYPETLFSYRLALLNKLYRIQSLFGLIKLDAFSRYVKIWTPSSCPALSTSQTSGLGQGLIGSSH